jgi:hypothetical protein
MTRARRAQHTHKLRAVLAALLACLLSVSAVAQSAVPLRQLLVRWSGHVPVVSFSVKDFLTREVVKKLDSGLPQNLITRVYAYPEDGKRPIAVSALTCRVVYDLWGEAYRVQVQSAGGERSLSVRGRDGIVRTCLSVDKLALGDAFAKYRGRRVYFAAIIELNPLSPETVQRIRRWLSKSGSPQIEGEAFFGSFVSIFVSRGLGSAERTMSFRSRSFDVPK